MIYVIKYALIMMLIGFAVVGLAYALEKFMPNDL